MDLSPGPRVSRRAVIDSSSGVARAQALRAANSTIIRVVMLRALLLLVLAGCATGGFDRRPWQDDYRLLRRHLSEAYANLEWEVESGVIDPAELDRRTAAALDTSTSPTEARAAI